ncbi:G5 domain-containing protein, partial [Burkholderia multivorans]
DGETNIDVTTAKALTVVADGKDHKVTAPVDTAGAALKEADIKLDKDDYLSVPMSASVTDGQVLTVNRVENKTVKEKQDIEPKVEKKKSESLFVSETKVEEKGKAGQK